MKKRLPLLFMSAMAAAGIQQVSAQAVLLKEDFEGEAFPPGGWVTHDADGDGKGWQLTADGTFEMSGTSRQIAISFARDPENYNSIYGAQDNWLVTPQFHVPNETVTVEFEYCAQDIEQVEPVEVLVSESGSDIADFTSLWSATADNEYEDLPVINSKVIPLTAYAGKNIRIAFRHQTSGTYGLSIDNVTVNNQNGPQTPKWYEVTADKNGGNSVYLKWLNPSKTTNGEDLSSVSTNIYRDGVKIHVVENQAPGSDGEWTDTSVTPGNYSYTISAFTEEGETRQISAKNVRVGEDIAAPVENTFAMVTADAVILTWEAPTEGANSTYSSPTVFNPENVTFIVKRSVDGTEPATIAEGLEETTLTDTDIEPGKTYSYTVQAQNPAGISEILEQSSAYIATADVADLAVAQTSERVNRSERVPFDTTDDYDITQSLYFPDELQFARGDIKSVIYKTYRSQESTVNVPVRIYMCETEKADFADKQWVDLTNATKVYEGTLPLVHGANDTRIDFTTPFTYNGGNIVVTVIKDGKPNGNYSDCFYTTASNRADRSMTTSTYSAVDVTNLPHSSYSDKATANVASIRFLMEVAGTGSLSGTVTDASSGSPVKGATVSIAEIEGLKAATDARGVYTIPYIPTGLYNVITEAVGYIPTENEINVTTAAVTRNMELTRLPNYTLTGTVKADDTSLPAEGAVVTISGYETLTTTADSDGEWSLPGVYSGKDYTLSIAYPGYDTYTASVNNDSQGTVTLNETRLGRSLIPPFAVNAEVAADGSNVTLDWNAPTARTGVPGEKSIGDVSTVYSDGGDYYYDDYSVAHLFDSASIEQQNMEGLSVTGMKVYIKAASGTFTAHVWEGDRDRHTVLAGKAIPADQLSSDGKWVEVTFDEPVEIKAGGTYMIGVNCKNADSSYPFGTAPSSSLVSGKNSVKFNEEGTAYDGYSAWCIIADCEVPASPSGIAENGNAPKCSYNVYRSTAASGWEKITTTPVRETSFTDAGWDGLGSGTFTYGVTAVYQNGESMKAYSDRLSRSNDCDVAVTTFVTPAKSVERRDKVNVTVTVTNLGEKPAAGIPVTLSLNGEEAASETLAATLNKGESANVDFGDINISEGVHTFTASTTLEGDMVPSNNALSLIVPNKENVELSGYRWSAYGNAGFMKIQSNNPEAADFRREFTTDAGLIIAAEYLEGKIYAYTATWYQEPQEFIEIDPVTWTVTKMTENKSHYILDMAYDYSSRTMYGLEPAGESVDLVQIDLATGAVTPTGSLGQVVRALACDKEGSLYGMAESGKLLGINPEGAQTTEIGDTGFGSAIYLQSMCFDHNTGRLFWAATGETAMGEIHEIDPATGKADLLGSTLFQNVEPSEIVGLYTPYDASSVGIGGAGGDANTITVDVTVAGKATVYTAKAAKAQVCDASGSCIRRMELLAGHSEFHLDLSAGVYMIRISDTDGRTATRKFVVR